jgi:hypothetical protein
MADDVKLRYSAYPEVWRAMDSQWHRSVYQAMTTFFDLFVRHSSDPSVRDDPKWADQRFPALVASSPFQLWRPGDPMVFKDNLRLLIGVATWSGYDMRLLDVIAEALGRNPADPPTIDVFNTVDCRSAEDFTRYIPGLHDISQMPVVGFFWRVEQLSTAYHGHAARESIAKIFGSTSAEIVAFVQDWIKGRAFAQ